MQELMQEQMEENGFDLLDVLVILAENLKLLILGPLVAGLIGLAVSYTLPKSFTSQAILLLPTVASSQIAQVLITLPPTPTQAANMMLTPVVLDPVIAARNLAGGGPLQTARAELAGRMKAVVGKDLLLRLDVTAGTPAEAQATANAIIDVWLKSTQPGPRDREGLERRLSYARAALQSIQRQLDQFASNGGGGRNTGARGDASASLTALSELEARYSAEILMIERFVDGLSRNVLLQEPTLPSEPVAPRKRLIAVGSALLCAFLLFLWVFVSYVWKISAMNPRLANKQERLLIALGLGPQVDQRAGS